MSVFRAAYCPGLSGRLFAADGVLNFGLLFCADDVNGLLGKCSLRNEIFAVLSRRVVCVCEKCGVFVGRW